MGEGHPEELLAELRRRVAERAAAGDYDLPWLDATVRPRDPVTPVDRFLQTPPVRIPPTLRGRLATPHSLEAARRGAEIDERLRDALAWIALALRAEQEAREGLHAEIVDERHRQDTAHDRRLGNLEGDVQALGFAHGERIWRLEDDRRWVTAAALRERHAGLIAPDARPLDLSAAEARVHSQNGEDGIILHLFSLIGATDRRFVEIGVEDGRECNSANLALNFGWSGVMVDRDPEGVASAQEFYDSLDRTRGRVRAVQRHVTREDIDALLVEVGAGDEIDLLSIDIDGNDLWVWEAVRSCRPRVVVIEYNASFGPERSVSVPYDPGFDRLAAHPGGAYHGASITALARVGARKGYVLAGCDSNGVNAFFVRQDCAEGRIAAAEPARAWRPIRERGTGDQLAGVHHLPLEEVP